MRIICDIQLRIRRSVRRATTCSNMEHQTLKRRQKLPSACTPSKSLPPTRTERQISCLSQFQNLLFESIPTACECMYIGTSDGGQRVIVVPFSLLCDSNFLPFKFNLSHSRRFATVVSQRSPWLDVDEEESFRAQSHMKSQRRQS